MWRLLRQNAFLVESRGALKAEGGWSQGVAFRNVAKCKRPTNPSIFLSSCWAFCVSCVPFLWVTSTKSLRHAGDEDESLGFTASAVWVCQPGQIAQILFSLLHCPSWFPTRMYFPQPDGQMHNLLHHWIYYETYCFPSVWNQCKQNQEAWFVAYIKHCFLYIIPTSCLLQDIVNWCVLANLQANAEAICHPFLKVTLL